MLKLLLSSKTYLTSVMLIPIEFASSTKFGKDVLTLSTPSMLISKSDLTEATANDIEMR